MHHTGVFANNDALARELVDCGAAVDDRAWHMPLTEEYGEQLKSNFADMANVAGRDGGSITAAAFLGKFTQGPDLGAPRHRRHRLPGRRRARAAPAARARCCSSTCCVARGRADRTLPPRVDFYVSEEAGDRARLRLACRVAEKAYLAKQKVVVLLRRCRRCCRASTNMLWTFGDGSFVPHDTVHAAKARPARRRWR